MSKTGRMACKRLLTFLPYRDVRTRTRAILVVEYSHSEHSTARVARLRPLRKSWCGVLTRDFEPMLETTYDRENLPHRLMWRIVLDHADLAKESGIEWEKPSLVAMVFGFHAMEAYLNYVGPKVAPEAWENEREYFRGTGFKGKLREVMDRAALPWEPGRRPLQTVLGLEKLRNTIAHGKPERRTGKFVHGIYKEPSYPAFSLHKLFAPKNKMPKAVHDLEQLANEIHGAVKLKSKVSDPWFGKEAFHGSPSFGSHRTTFKNSS